MAILCALPFVSNLRHTIDLGDRTIHPFSLGVMPQKGWSPATSSPLTRSPYEGPSNLPHPLWGPQPFEFLRISPLGAPGLRNSKGLLSPGGLQGYLTWARKGDLGGLDGCFCPGGYLTDWEGTPRETTLPQKKTDVKK